MSDKYYQEFIRRIEDEELSRSISNIKQTVASIWTNDVRIIKGYTGHGLEHSERIFGKLHEILWPDNAIELLSERELYILILGVILHDIGMQCDVKKYPEIKDIAINRFGASFLVTFSEGPASGYSIEEQKELRKNHHLLTAAWLDYIFSTVNPVLPTISLDSVPSDLREDLIDVCRFHSKLNIQNCPDKSDSQIHTRLIAALLRLGDELDIDRCRVDINTVKLFGYDVENSIYWYLHAYTVVNIQNHQITLKVPLNKKDYEKCAEFFKTKVIEDFIKKNSILTEIIRSNNINIGISSESAVVNKLYQKSLPPEICDYIETTANKNDSSIDTPSSSILRLYETAPKKSSITGSCYDCSESSQKECIENVLKYFCEVNKKALNLKKDIEAVIVVWTDKHIKRRTFYSYNKSKGAPLHNVRDYSFGVVGMLQEVMGNLDDNDKRADCILFYDHEKKPTECEYIIDFRAGDVEKREVEEQKWINKGTKAMLAISLFRQKGDIPQVFGALTFDFAETLKDKGSRQRESLFYSVRQCRDILIPLLVTEIKTDYKDQLLSLEKIEEEWISEDADREDNQ